MAANPRFELTSSSSEGAAFGYSSSHRPHFASGTSGSSIEKSASFRENHDSSGRMITPGGSGQTFTSPSSANAHGEVQLISQILSVDLTSSDELKYARQLELRKATVAAMAMIGEVNGNLQQKPLEQQGVEELKRIRLSLLENATHARERSRGLSEATMKLEKLAALRKWSHTESPVFERTVTSGSGERPMLATGSSANVNKSTFCASPSHTSTSEGNMAKPDEKTKGGIPNKRMRTSMQDTRPENRIATPNFQRSSSGVGDRERESIKLGVVPHEKDRLAQGSAEGWERMKTKGKRSATKLECVITTGTPESERDHKWGAQHRTNTDNRPRPNEGHSFRSGPVHGIVSIHKSAMRNESDNTVSVGDKGDWLPFPEKDRPMLKGGTKLSHKDGGSLVIQTTVGKAKVARAPRTGTMIPINPAGGHVSRPHSAEVWDRPVASNSTAASNRAQIPVLPNNRKRPTPTRSSSPPVAQWVGQRSQKMARIARRINVAPPVTPTGVAKEEGMSVSSEADSVAIPSGVRSNLNISPVSGLVKKLTSSSVLSQMKPKTERIPSPAGLSESEDSEVGDMKSKEKWKKHGDAESRLAAINQKSAASFSTGKKSLIGKDDGGDGIRRQGRSGRAVIAVRESVIVPQVEKGEVATANAKQLRTTRPGSEKPEKNSDVKPGRPPSKKGGVGDRKGLTRLRRPTINGSEISGGWSESDDDHEELMAAVQASLNASLHACSSVFWKEMEPFFAYLTQDARESLRVKDREFKEEEILLGLFTSDASVEKNSRYPNSSEIAKVSNVTIGSEVNGSAVSMAFNNLKEQGADVRTGGWINSKELSLSQRLLSALIIEEDIEDSCREELEPRSLSRDGSYHDPSDSEQPGLEKEQDSDSEVETRRTDNGQHNVRSKRSPYGSSYISNGHRHWGSESEPQISPANSELKKEEQPPSDINGLKKWDGAYHDLKLDDRIALELQSIGLYPEPVDFVAREDNQIVDELKKSYVHLKEQVHTNKARLSSLEKAVSSSQEAEEREREQLAMRKLLENAFAKRLGNRGGLLGVSGNKSTASRAGRANALAMAKRCVARWKHFVETGESCFTEAGLREVLLCVSSKDGEKAYPNGAEFQAGINSVGLSLMGSLELKSSGSVGTRWICHAPGMHKGGKDHSEGLAEKDDVWCNRAKEREVLLEDVVTSGIANVSYGSKGKRSERERDGSNVKGSSRHGLSGTIKGERKTKTKPRQKTAPLLKAVNGLLAKPNDTLEKSGVRVRPETSSSGAGAQSEGGEPTLDLTHLQIPLMDDLVVNGDLEGQGQDLGSWLDFDDPGLPDAGGDFMGLDVPMDDLADLAMMM